MRLAQYLRAVAARARGERAELAPTVDPIREAIRETGEQLAAEMGQAKRPEWLELAAPLIERFEGMARLIPGGKVEAYPDPATGGAPFTIGIGSTTDEDGNPIKPGTVWTVERARARFEEHVKEFAAEVDRLIDGAPTTPAQKAACVSLAYNIGIGSNNPNKPGGLTRSTVLRMHKRGEYQAAADTFLLWNKAAGKVMRGLTRRREAERALYLS